MNKYVVVPLFLVNALVATGLIVYGGHKDTYAQAPAIDARAKLEELNPNKEVSITAPHIEVKPEPVAVHIEPPAISAKQVCYQFITNQLTDQITALPNFNSSMREEKIYTIYWGLGAEREPAVAKFNDLKSKGVFEQKTPELVLIAQKYAIPTGTRSNDREALGSVREMSLKTASLGGQWFYMSAPSKTYVVKFTTSDVDLAQRVAQTYAGTQECG